MDMNEIVAIFKKLDYGYKLDTRERLTFSYKDEVTSKYFAVSVMYNLIMMSSSMSTTTCFRNVKGVLPLILSDDHIRLKGEFNIHKRKHTYLECDIDGNYTIFKIDSDIQEGANSLILTPKGFKLVVGRRSAVDYLRSFHTKGV